MVDYFKIAEAEPLPNIAAFRPFKAVLVIDAVYSDEWRNLVSTWLVTSGCLYMVAWGKQCSEWHDCVDWVHIEEFNFGEIPDDKFVMTTWHENESLQEAFWFAQFCAHHPDVDLETTLIIHVSAADRKTEMLAKFEAVATSQ